MSFLLLAPLCSKTFICVPRSIQSLICRTINRRLGKSYCAYIACFSFLTPNVCVCACAHVCTCVYYWVKFNWYWHLLRSKDIIIRDNLIINTVFRESGTKLAINFLREFQKKGREFYKQINAVSYTLTFAYGKNVLIHSLAVFMTVNTCGTWEKSLQISFSYGFSLIGSCFDLLKLITRKCNIFTHIHSHTQICYLWLSQYICTCICVYVFVCMCTHHWEQVSAHGNLTSIETQFFNY